MLKVESIKFKGSGLEFWYYEQDRTIEAVQSCSHHETHESDLSVNDAKRLLIFLTKFIKKEEKYNELKTI